MSILNKYARAINHDFSEDIADLPPSILEDPDDGYNQDDVNNFKEVIRERDEWKEKYYALIEKYIQCMEKEQKG